MVFPLTAVPVEEVELYLAKYRPEWKPPQRALVARLSEGALGRARNFDVEAYVAARADALAILNSALVGGEHTQLFKITESYRAGAEGREKTEQLLRTLYSLLRDLMFLGSGAPGLVHNTDIQSQLTKLAEGADFDWISAASDRLADVERGMRRNLLRSLSLDDLSLALEKTAVSTR
jgi:DNA polymerase-3 subunit delta'